MNLRLTASVVFLGTLASACGTESRPSATTSAKSAAARGPVLASIGGAVETTNAVEKTVKSTSSALVAELGVVPEGQDVRFTFRVVNKTPKSVEVNFASARADVPATDKARSSVGSRSSGRKGMSDCAMTA